MRIETYKGCNIVCGHIFPVEDIKIGQKWMSVSGNVVTVTNINGEWVDYAWESGSHRKDSFSFQCRYFLIVESVDTTLE